MNSTTIQKVMSLGYRVFMRKPEDSWLIYTDGTNIGYLQEDRFRGFTITTVHRPNHSTGTGFQIIRDEGTFSVMDLKHGFCIAPEWASNSERASVIKYADIEQYRKADPFNAEYQEVFAK